MTTGDEVTTGCGYNTVTQSHTVLVTLSSGPECWVLVPEPGQAAWGRDRGEILIRRLLSLALGLGSGLWH